MQNSLGEPQSILVLGGTSEIGLAIARALDSPSLRHIVLACRDLVQGEAAAASLRRDGLTAEVVAFDAARPDTHTALVDDVSGRVGDIDLVVLAFGVLGDQAQFEADPVAAASAVTVNYTGAVSVGLAVGNRLRQQGHGTLVVLSSVAGERARKANFVYGSSKAGLDAFAQGLGDSLVGTGARVLVVRPGFVHSRMTAGMKAAPLSTTPDAVAAVTASALRGRRRTVWVPGPLRYLFIVLRHLPGAVFRRLPLG